MVTPQGQLVYLDFGMMGVLDVQVTRPFANKRIHFFHFFHSYALISSLRTYVQLRIGLI